MKFFILHFLHFIFFLSSTAQKNPNDALREIDNFNNSMQYTRGNIELPSKDIVLRLPNGFKYLNIIQSKIVLESVWKNEPVKNLQGMIFLENGGPLVYNSFAFVITYNNDGFVQSQTIDNTAPIEKIEHINIPEIENPLFNAADAKYSWKLKPLYIINKQALYSIAEEKAANAKLSMMIYKYFLFGKKGYVQLEAYASSSLLPKIASAIDAALGAINFTNKNEYANFNANSDKVNNKDLYEIIYGKKSKDRISSNNSKWSFADYLKSVVLVVLILLMLLWLLLKKIKVNISQPAKSSSKKYSNNSKNYSNDTDEYERKKEREQQRQYERERESSEREREKEREYYRERERERERRRYDDDY